MAYSQSCVYLFKSFRPYPYFFMDFSFFVVYTRKCFPKMSVEYKAGNSLQGAGGSENIKDL
tara:strand:+ start:679 stop:861 length:183 start_codon:yes stop_codon:yes gene_type:complete